MKTAKNQWNVVERKAFDAILGKLIASPPKPVTPKRKARKRKAKPAQ